MDKAEYYRPLTGAQLQMILNTVLMSHEYNFMDDPCHSYAIELMGAVLDITLNQERCPRDVD